MGCCGVDYTSAEDLLNAYTDEEARAHAEEVGVDPRPNETISEIDETGAFIRQPNAFIQPFGDKEGDLKAEADRYAIYWAVGCNWNFAPIVDLTYNWRNTIVQIRAFNNVPDDVIRYSKAFFKGTKTREMATCMKHFPGDGTEENDQHLIMGVNEMSCEEWDQTYGKVYKALIDEILKGGMAASLT